MYSQGVEQTLEQDAVLLYLVHFLLYFCGALVDVPVQPCSVAELTYKFMS